MEEFEKMREDEKEEVKKLLSIPAHIRRGTTILAPVANSSVENLIDKVLKAGTISARVSNSVRTIKNKYTPELILSKLRVEHLVYLCKKFKDKMEKEQNSDAGLSMIEFIE